MTDLYHGTLPRFAARKGMGGRSMILKLHVDETSPDLRHCAVSEREPPQLNPWLNRPCNRQSRPAPTRPARRRGALHAKLKRAGPSGSAHRRGHPPRTRRTRSWGRPAGRPRGGRGDGGRGRGPGGNRGTRRRPDGPELPGRRRDRGPCAPTRALPTTELERTRSRFLSRHGETTAIILPGVTTTRFVLTRLARARVPRTTK